MPHAQAQIPPTEDLLTRRKALAEILLRKLFLACLAFALLLSGLLGAEEYWRINREVKGTLRYLADTFTPAAETALWDFQEPLLATLANGIGNNPSVAFVEIRDTLGVFHASWRAGKDLRPSSVLQVRQELVKVKDDGSRQVLGTLIIASSDSLVRVRLADTFIRVGSVGILLLLMMMSVLWILARTLIVRRIETLAEYARSLNPSALEESSAPGIEGPHDELMDLGLTLNDLRSRLVERMRELREADASIQAMNARLLQALDRAEAANQAKSNFLRKMSHEFLTPLNHVQLHAELLEEDMADANAEARKDVLAIRHTTQRLAEQVRDILDLVDLESTSVHPCWDFLDGHALAETLKARVLPWAKANRNALDIDLQGLPRSMKGDVNLLAQALEKLLHNACRFTEGGKVSLVASGTHEEALFEVRDTGKGMGSEELERIFGVFDQGDEGLTRAYGGMGLGLAVCQHLVQKMGGHVSVESRPGEGSVFRIHLPGNEPIHPPE